VELTQYQGLPIGERAPDFSLPGVDGETYSLASFRDKQILVIAFWCNHCPYVRAWEDRTIAAQNEYAAKGVQFVAINPNETQGYPEDDFPHMVERAKGQGYTFPYLRDDTQKVAEAYGGVCTPDFFVFDRNRRLRYGGRLDDSKDPNSVKRRYMREVLDALVAGREPPVSFAPPMGCSIKWKSVHYK